MARPTTQHDFVAFELQRLARWVRMLTELDTIVAAFPSEVLDERRRLLNRIIFNQCASLSRAGFAAEVEQLVAQYRSRCKRDSTSKGADQ